MAKTVEKYKVFDLELSGTSQGNPFQDVQLTADFSNGIQKLTVKGFYKDQGKYGIRFMPQAEGNWTYETHSSDPQLDGQTGEFLCTSRSRQPWTCVPEKRCTSKEGSKLLCNRR